MVGWEERSGLGPIFPDEALDAAEFSSVRGNQNKLMTNSLAYDQQVIGADWFAIELECSADSSGNLGVVFIEG